MKGALYGLKQSSDVWGKMFESFMLKSGFKQCIVDTCIYTRGSGQSCIILGIHVDDQAIIGPNKHVIDKFKSELSKEFKMKDLGSLTHILGLEVEHDRKRPRPYQSPAPVAEVSEGYDRYGPHLRRTENT